MDIKKILTFIIVVIVAHNAQSQQLTLNETITYINQSISNDEKLILSQDGMLEYSNISEIGTPYTYKVHISEIRTHSEVVLPVFNNFDGSHPWKVWLECKRSKENSLNSTYSLIPCIQATSHNKKSNSSYFSLSTKAGDKNSAEKLLNAVNYLFIIAKENGLYERKDNDPFAPNNFNPKGIEIKSTANNAIIKLDRENGIYYITVTIGGIKRKFVLDSGASEVLLSDDFEKELVRKGIIKKENYITPGLYRIADGSIVQCKRLIIPQLIIGGFTIKNVQASVGLGSVPLLLGKSVLDKFKKWTIDNLTETLNLEK